MDINEAIITDIKHRDSELKTCVISPSLYILPKAERTCGIVGNICVVPVIETKAHINISNKAQAPYINLVVRLETSEKGCNKYILIELEMGSKTTHFIFKN
jgi:hypothetical protein